MLADSISLDKRTGENTDRTKGERFFSLPPLRATTVMRDSSEERRGTRGVRETTANIQRYSTLHGSTNSETKNFLLMGTKGKSISPVMRRVSRFSRRLLSIWRRSPNIRGENRAGQRSIFPFGHVATRMSKPRRPAAARCTGRSSSLDHDSRSNDEPGCVYRRAKGTFASGAATYCRESEV